jgi:hypothetical protein
VYCGDDLPLSFWMTYWPSKVALAEHMPTAQSEQQVSVLLNHAHLSEMSNLQYLKNHGIIHRYLKQYTEGSS